MINDPTYFVPSDETRWVQRMEAACRVLETRFGIHLDKADSGTKNHMTKKDVPDRQQYFKKCLKTKNRWFSLFNVPPKREVASVTASSGFNMRPGHFAVGGKMYLDGATFSFSAFCPELPVERIEQLLVSMGDALEAHSSQYSPRAVIWRQRLAHWCTVFGSKVVTHDLPDRTPEELRLPRIKESPYSGLQPLQPHHLGWINYWSEEVCSYVGFPENAAGTAILEHCYRTPRGAWIVKLAAEPFKLGDPAQSELLREFYERFPRVGVRIVVPGAYTHALPGSPSQ
jgi:hypothetical protein